MSKSLTKLENVIICESWGQGGTESYVRGLIKSLEENGLDVALVLLKTEPHFEITVLPNRNVFITSIFDLFGFLYRSRTKNINLHLYTSLLPVTVISKMLRINVITTVHMPPRSWGVRHRVYWKIALRLANRVVGVSRLVNDQVCVNTLYPEPVPGGVCSDFFEVETVSKSGSGGGERHRIFAVGRLSKEKDWPTLVRAVSMLPDNLRNKIVVDFFGDGALRQTLKELARDLEVSVTFHGFVDKQRLAIEFGDAQISVLPSRFEGFGLAAIESMAAGVPTITSDFEASKDFITEGETGYRFSAGDAEALSRLLLEIIENPFKANEIARKGREFVYQNFSEEKTYLPYLNLFHHDGSIP